MVVATVLVMVLPAAIVWVLSARGVLDSLWAAVALSAVLALGFSSAGSAYWRRHASGDVLFSDLLVWGWLRRRRMERRIGRADELLSGAGGAEPERKEALLRELSGALDAKDTYLDGHSRRVARYAEMTARKLELPEDQVERVRAAALIHDIGKLHISEEILRKPGRLTDDEFEVMKTHAAEGGRMAEALGEPALAAIVGAHHERFDGGGYPDGLAGEQIPLEARIISVADTFDAITAVREYKQGRTHGQALEVIAEEAGGQLDPDAAQAFISCYSDRARRRAVGEPGVDPPPAGGTAVDRPGRAGGRGGRSGHVGGGRRRRRHGGRRAAGDVRSAAGRGRGAGGRDGASDADADADAASVRLAERRGGLDHPRAAGRRAGRDGARARAVGRGRLAERGRDAATATVRSQPTPSPTPAAAPPSRSGGAASRRCRRGRWTRCRRSPTAEPVPTPTPPPPEPTAGPPSPTPSPEPTAGPPSPTPTATPTPAPPHTVDDCRNGGWVDLGYPNQGQCIAEADKP